ncbi:type ISP restriction/modification enzyme [Nonomuraea sp. NPDC049400]|uniref:type ISP restriction/modification enzyme n=1 Tax=Nonomuraea sp. NPDC049400 TaxID=3364352 RepID=UPI003790CBB8
MFMHGQALSSGPGLIFTTAVQDQHHFNDRGGTVIPLYHDSQGVTPNLAPRLTSRLGERLDRPIKADDFVAYLAAVIAHPGYTTRFQDELGSLYGIRVPLTADRQLWEAATEIGRDVIWLHTFGARGHPGRRPRVPLERRPQRIRRIPDDEDNMPETMTYDPRTRTLYVGSGAIAPVAPEVYAYDVGGMPVIRKWFSYRQRDRLATRQAASRLDHIRARRWSLQFTEDLLDLLQVLTLLTDLHPAQDALLEQILAAPLISTADMTAARVLPVPPHLTRPQSADRQDPLF